MNVLKVETYENECVENILERKSKIEIEKYRLQKKIFQLIQMEKELNKKLWTTCKHDWVLDSACSSDDLCKRYCSKCQLKNLKSMYI